MKISFAIIFRSRKDNKYQWQFSILKEEFKAVDRGNRVAVSVFGSNILLRFSPEGRVFNAPPLGHYVTCSFVPNALPELGVPIGRCRWSFQALQVSTNPVTFSFPVPDLTGYVRLQPRSVVNGGATGVPREDTRAAMDLLNERLSANPAFKAYVRPDGTIGVRVMIEEDL